jgi:branched-chain amino acid transport system ATP-binding protein
MVSKIDNVVSYCKDKEIRMLLKTENICSGYGNKEVIHNASLHINEGELVGIVGHNGAGKTTMLNTILGLIPLKKGEIVFFGRDISNSKIADRVKVGISLVPQGQSTFSNMSVRDNLKFALFIHTDKRKGSDKSALSATFDLFPVLHDRQSQIAGTLSGGERQMLALAMGILSRPKIMMIDEPTLGLSPLLSQKLEDAIRDINSKYAISVIVVQESIEVVCSLARRIYVMKLGEIVLEEEADKLAKMEDHWEIL